MENGGQSERGSRSDRRVRLSVGVGICVGATFGQLIRALVHLDGFWLSMIAYAAVLGVGAGLGRLAGYFLFQRHPGK
jgi:multidrug transporter EmrE-like cation transporter